MSDPEKSPDEGTDGEEGESQEAKWKLAGFESEEEMVKAACEATELREKIKDAETSRSKTDSEYLKQSNEIGQLRKKLKELDGKGGESAPVEKDSDNEKIISELSDDELKKFDEILDKPENLKLKQAVVTGGTKAMAEFVKSYQQNAPIDMSAPVFASLKRKKSEMIPKSSIANMVKSLFEQTETEQRNKMPATGISGTIGERGTATKKVSSIGQVTADFFRRDKNF